ncbi:MAG: hypothetical protein JWO53_949 [Chlamydiia bacterium]|nr:hypothetical protein [Chlamydiia bacterium]
MLQQKTTHSQSTFDWDSYMEKSLTAAQQQAKQVKPQPNLTTLWNRIFKGSITSPTEHPTTAYLSLFYRG